MQNVLLIFLFLVLGACQSAPKKNSGQSGSYCFRFIGQNQVQEFTQNIKDCLLHRSQDGTTPLMLASALGKTEIQEILFQQKIDVNEVDLQGDTALHYAVSRNQLLAAEQLMKNKAQVRSQRPDGITSLMQAIQFGSFEMVQILTQDQEAINDPAEDGWTALYFAIRRKDKRILEEILKKGACTNIFDAYKQTPLDFVKEVQWPEGENLLLKAEPC